MNIHEHQAKEILKSFGAPVAKGVAIFSIDEAETAIASLPGQSGWLKAKFMPAGAVKAISKS